jgi:hypothetical protein
MPTPSAPGIYVATLRSNELVPVTQDTRYVQTCGRVNCSNVKVGKARNLALRERDYWKDFGADNVSFVAIAITQEKEIQAAETAVLRRLRTFRKRSPKGGMMDWLQDIAVDEAIAMVHEALTNARITYEHP